jgi:hypothetical protein
LLSSAGCKLQSPQAVKCTWNNVAPADVKVLQFTVKGTEAGVFTNKATVSSTGSAPKEATVETTLTPDTLPPPVLVSY